MAHAGDNRHRWSHRTLPLLFTLLVNGGMLDLLCALTNPPTPQQTVIAVELQREKRIETLPPAPQPEVIRVPAPPPLPEPSRQQHIAQVIEDKQLFSHPMDHHNDKKTETQRPPLPPIQPFQTAQPAVVETPSPTSSNSGAFPHPAAPSGGTGNPSPSMTIGGVGAGTLATGPGAATPQGAGGGTVGNSERGTYRPTNQVDDPAPPRPAPRQAEEPKEDKPAASPPPQPAPAPASKGESRNAQLVSNPKPAYPQDAREDGVEGIVTLAVTVDTAGKVSAVKITRSSGVRRLDRAAERTVKRWHYTPRLVDGSPTETTLTVKVDFRLD